MVASSKFSHVFILRIKRHLVFLNLLLIELPSNGFNKNSENSASAYPHLDIGIIFASRNCFEKMEHLFQIHLNIRCCA